MADWIIRFRTLHAEDLLEVRVGGADQNKVLLGSGEPFVTEEDDGDNEFCGVRLQSGYLRIVDTGFDDMDNAFDWHDMIPTTGTSRPVTLKEGNNVLWRGYLQPMAYSGSYGVLPQERAFALMCPLSALGGMEIGVPEDSVVSFGDLLEEILGQVGFDSQHIRSQTQYWEDWKKVLIQKDALTTVENGSVKMRYTSLQLLDEICRFWGMCCRVDGEYAYLMSATLDDPMLDWDALVIGDDAFCDTLSNESVYGGYSRTRVSAEIGRQEEVMKYPPSSLLKEMMGQTVERITLDTDKYLYRTFPIYEFSNYHLNGWAYYNVGVMNGCFRGLDYYEGDPAKKHNYEWTWAMSVNTDYVGQQTEDIPIRLWTSKRFLFPSGGLLVLNGDISRFGKPLESIYGMKMRVGIGVTRASARWWDGSAWSANDSVFDVSIGEGEGIWCNRQLSDPYAAYDGWGIPISSVMYGCLFVDFLGAEYLAGFDVSDFSVSYVPSSSMNDNETNVYEFENQSYFTDEKSEDVGFASYNHNVIGNRILMTDGMDVFVNYHYQSGLRHPESALMSRISSWGSKARRVFRMDLRRDVLGTNGKCIERPTIDGCVCYAQSIGRNWRDDVLMYKFVEL